MADLPSFDELQDDSVVQPQVEAQGQDVPSFDQLVSDEEKYGSPGQQLKAGIEGLAEGVLGPVAPYLEKKLLHVTGADIRAREEANPIISGIGQGIGLAGSAFIGVGEGAIMTKAGEAAAEALNLAQPVSYAAKVGSSAVKQAAEMAVLQSSDEIAKQVLNDPGASAESAIANIGLAAALGGAAGGFMTGAVSPLWSATVGKPVEKVLSGLKDHLDGASKVILPQDVGVAAETLGINLSPEMRAGLSGDPKAAMLFNELREIQHPSITAQLKNLETSANDSVLNAIGQAPEEIANYSKAEGGKRAMDAFKQEYMAKYEPIEKEFTAITEPFKAAPVYPSQVATLADKITQMSTEKGYLGADLPQNKIVNSVLDRLPSLKTAEDFKKLNTTINNMTKGDLQLMQVGRDLKSVLEEAHHNTLAYSIGKDAPELMARYNAVRSAYSDLAKISNDLGTELGLGKFVGPKTLLMKLSEKRSPEQFLSRLSPKGNAEIIGFLGRHFPETLEIIRQNELQQILRPAVLAAKGESAINAKVLNNAIEKGLAGEPERIKFAMPKGAIERIQAAKTLMEAIPGMKSSGTAGWQQKMMAYVPQSAMAAVSMLMGHNPVFGYIGGHLGKLLARDVPDAIKYGLLKFMASDQPIKAEGFKAMIDFLSNTIKGQTLLMKSTANVFKGGAQVLAESQMPKPKDREKLDKVVEKYQKLPDTLMNLTQGQTGHYLPNHQQELTQSSTRAVQYLATLKPKTDPTAPLDKALKPSAEQIARYNRALDIANSPAIVLEHIKNGTLQTSDMVDLKSMYPSLYNQFAKQLSNEMINKKHDLQQIPYKTRMGLSLFLGQPVDSTMTPMAIQSAQPQPKPMPQAPTGQPKGKPEALRKVNMNYMTPNEASEYRRIHKD